MTYLNVAVMPMISCYIGYVVMQRVPLVPPFIADEPTTMVVTRLSPVVIGCTASGVPEPTIQWSKDGIILLTEEGGYSILPTGDCCVFSCFKTVYSNYCCEIIQIYV